jgi:A/G-specific adenine glycosylase
MSAQSTPTNAAAFRRSLLAWYRRAARDLPWRRTRDPYAVLVSEFMLQQTQVSRVVEFYGPFLARYPTVRHLARARAAQVREAWDGLGYYRRAANLHRLAREVVAEHDGLIPRDPADLRRLPGVGAYTAGAVATFAYEQPTAAVDTNVARVLARAFAGTDVRKGGGTPVRPGPGRKAGSPPAPVSLRDITSLAEALQPRRGRTAWAFNQALMELGALVCTARAPKCPACPVRSACRWYGKAGRTKARRPL